MIARTDLQKDRRLLDTNIIARYLVQDVPAHAAIANRLFSATERGELTLVLLPVVLAETIYLLESFYGVSRVRIKSGLSVLITIPGVELAELRIHLDALERYEQTKLHFVDCLLIATAASSKMTIATFDRGIARQSDVDVSVDV